MENEWKIVIDTDRFLMELLCNRWSYYGYRRKNSNKSLLFHAAVHHIYGCIK